MRLAQLAGLLSVFTGVLAHAEGLTETGNFALGQPLYQSGLLATPQNQATHNTATEDSALLPNLFSPNAGPGISVRGSLTPADNASFSLDSKNIEGAELSISIPN